MTTDQEVRLRQYDLEQQLRDHGLSHVSVEEVMEWARSRQKPSEGPSEPF